MTADIEPTVSIVIPAYRQPLLEQCLASLRNLEDDGVAFDVHLVLNDVPDEIRTIARGFPGLPITIHDLPMNLGGNGGLNYGFAASTAPYLLPLQDDSTVEPGLLAVLLERLQEEDDIGACAALVTDFDGLVHDAGWIIWNDATPTPRWFGTSRDPSEFEHSCAVPHHSTHAALFRREAWESIGGFDDEYYPVMYGDVDVSLSLRRRGWRVVVEPRARSSQRVNGSTTPLFVRFLLDRHAQRLREKHGSWLAEGPARVETPAEVAEVARQFALAPPGPRPAPPSDAELRQLAARLDRDPLLIMRRERDLLTDYRRYLEDLHQGNEKTLADTRHELAETRQSLDAIYRDLDAQRRAYAELLQTHTSIMQSRSWRWLHPARAVARRVRGTRTSE